MKNSGIKTGLMLLFVMLILSGMDVIAQRGRGMGRAGGLEQICPNIPNLTEDQRSQIMELRTAHLREMQTFRDQIDVNRTQYRALMRSERTDMAAIDANIDERNNIRNQMEKKRASHLQSIRTLLTDDQRVWFDAAPRGGPGFRQPGPGGRGAMRTQPGFRRGF